MIDKATWGLPDWAEDRIHTDVHVHLDWRDRLRVLLAGRLVVEARTLVEHAPGRCETISAVRLPRIRWPWQARPEMVGYTPSERG